MLDGVSWHLILEDLATLVAQAAEGQALRLPEKNSLVNVTGICVISAVFGWSVVR